jgi:hypothetical protein
MCNKIHTVSKTLRTLFNNSYIRLHKVNTTLYMNSQIVKHLEPCLIKKTWSHVLEVIRVVGDPSWDSKTRVGGDPSSKEEKEKKIQMS